MLLFKIIRVPNLLIIVLTMLAMRYGLMYPMVGINGFELQMPTAYFVMLVVATVLIAAAGYIINDYFDVKIDTINKPNQNLIGMQFKRRWAMLLHVVFNAIAILLAWYVSYKIGNTKLAMMYVLAACLLWFYSTHFKKQLIIGNVIIAFLSGAIPIIIGLFEMPLMYKQYGQQLKEYGINFNFISYFMIGFGAFAFAISWVREIVKDIEDQQGDAEYDCETMPIVWGTKVSAYFAATILGITITTIGYLQYIQYTSDDKLSVYYIAAFVQLPLILCLIKLIKASTKEEFSTISKLIKLSMVMGILYAGVIHYQIIHPALQAPEQAHEVVPSVSIGGGY
jgi:4-hydroxybenzoate polyprenyltransferase